MINSEKNIPVATPLTDKTQCNTAKQNLAKKNKIVIKKYFPLVV